MVSTPFGDRIRDLGEAGAELQRLMDVLVASCEQVGKDLDNGVSPLDSILSIGGEEGQAFRREVNAAMKRFEQAMQASRAESFRVLVRDGGFSVSLLAGTTGLSTQMIRRLLRIAEDA